MFFAVNNLRQPNPPLPPALSLHRRSPPIRSIPSLIIIFRRSYVIQRPAISLARGHISASVLNRAAYNPEGFVVHMFGPRKLSSKCSISPYVSMVAGRSMSRVWLRMSDDFWLHLRLYVKFALVTLYRVTHTRPHMIQNFAIYIRSIFA